MNPQVLDCTIPTNDPRVPALCLLDALHEQGWVSKSAVVTHSSEADKTFDSRNPVKAKSYFRCVLFNDFCICMKLRSSRVVEPTFTTITYLSFASFQTTADL